MKRRRELPNNETFTKALVEKNHELVRRNRALEARLAHVSTVFFFWLPSENGP